MFYTDLKSPDFSYVKWSVIVNVSSLIWDVCASGRFENAREQVIERQVCDSYDVVKLH